MIGVLESLAQGLVAASVIIASLQAGSRVICAVSQNESRVMDGPLILSPNDVKELEKDGEFGDVSPLWEATFGFRKALDLLSDVSRRNGTLPVDVRITSWEKEISDGTSSYMMAFPHQSQIDDGSSTNDDTEKENRLIVVPSPDEKSITNIKIFNPFGKIYDIFTNMVANCKMFMSRSEIYNAMFHVDPIMYLRKVREFNQRKAANENFQENERPDSPDMDFIYTTKITLPCDTENTFGETEVRKQAIIKAYAPATFQQLRRRFGISEHDFVQSLLKSGPYVSFQSNSKGAARAGGFFFFSKDGAYMVKTIKSAEAKTIREMLPKYSFFMKRNAKRSLLTRFCGLYSVQLLDESGKKTGEECVFLIMNSVFPAKGSKFISERFDLKGSTVGRECSRTERAEKGNQAVLKDLDLQREVDVMKSIPHSFGLNNYGISIGPKAKSALLSQLRRDVKLLVSCSVMDYSLLIGVVNLDSISDETNDNLFVFMNKETIKLLRRMLGRHYKHVLALSSWLLTPLLHFLAPAIFVCQILLKTCAVTFSSIITPPFPYYGASLCGVDGGELSVLTGSRLGHRALYYVGVIDFLQPWTTQKVLEKELKGLMGYEKMAISCAHPVDYAERFLEFMDRHIT